MSHFDTILRRASVVTATGLQTMDVGISGEIFADMAPDLRGSAAVEIDVSGKVMFPGLVDAHVHFNEPGRTEWEGFATGSTALAAGGGTTFIDMPLNSTPPVLDVVAFEAKRRAGEANSRLDFALWGGLTPGSLPHLPHMARAGVVGFKAFMCPSGLDEFAAAGEHTLRMGMHVAAEFGLPVAVHAESPAAITAHQKVYPPPSPGSMADWLRSRPVAAELAAIEMAIQCAKDTGCALHIVHISTAQGVALVSSAKKAGINVTAETCPHYLLLDTEAAIRIGPAAKCAPPLREAGSVDGLWRALVAGDIDTIGSDHSPSPPELKEGDDVFSMWGGIAGCQHGFPLLLERALGVTNWEQLALMCAAKPAGRFGLSSRKGAIAPGLDADFCLLRLDPHVIEEKDLLARHPISPYVGMRSAWRVEATWLRGNPVSPATHGQLLTPDT
ncbi:allantoinase AllB [Luteolibacter luteus]|uniref:Allantoinase AllB n=1 Tax=Luteolibacter luteus TaxID=2728835 RepID=A0A858RHS8_9BACT|nr:allantoinase AllB [Luteolibacter luteus]QJE96068.1 allantoinase AllB [Luteolibacter luteus]